MAADTTPPSVTAPVASPRTNAVSGASTVPFTVSWTGTDASGIARWTLQDRWTAAPGDGLAPERDGDERDHQPPTPARVRVPGAGNRHLGQHERVRGGPDVPGAAPRRDDARALDDRRLAAARERGLPRRPGAGLRPTGATATFTFTGSQVAWIATRAANRGLAAIVLDGVPTTTVDLARTTTEYRRLVFAPRVAIVGDHTLTITVAGTAGHPYVDVDGFVVVDPPAPTRCSSAPATSRPAA